MKRGRDQTPEEEPLSKRINNLHLGGSSQLMNGSGPTGLPLVTPPGHPLAPSTNSPQGHLNNIPIVNGLSNNNVPNGLAHNGTNGLSPGMVGHSGAEQANLEAMAEEMIARRELPESLSISYPNLNPTENDQYFSFNRTLHHLHIERLRRMGKIAL